MGVIPGLATPLAHFLDGQGLPDVLLPAGVLDEGCWRAEGGEGEGCVFAGVVVGVVAAHLYFSSSASLCLVVFVLDVRLVVWVVGLTEWLAGLVLGLVVDVLSWKGES